MARAMTYTNLSLDRFFQLVGIHPLHGNQVMLHDIAEIKVCGQPILQYSWQDADRVGREEIAQAIYDAEQQIASYTHFFIGPTYTTEEVAAAGYDGRLTLKWKYVLGAGVRTKALIEAGVVVSYSDLDGDGYEETAEVTVPAIADAMADEYRVYYPDEDGEDAWEVRGVKTEIVGANAVLRLKREQLVVKDQLEGLAVGEVDGLVDANFLEEVDVYRVHGVSDEAVIWRGWGCNCCGTAADSYQCLDVVNSRLGIVATSRSCAASPSCATPGRLLVSYKSGVEGQYWERAVAYLALSMLDNPICSCPSLERYAKYWRTDMALQIGSPGRRESFRLSNRKLDNPFGTTRAGLYVWEMVSKHYVGP